MGLDSARRFGRSATLGMIVSCVGFATSLCQSAGRYPPPHGIYCPHLNPIERLWGVMHKNITHNKTYGACKEFAEATLDFLRDKVLETGPSIAAPSQIIFA